MEISDERSRKTEDCDIDYNVRHARADVHDRVIGRGSADDPVAPERPDLKEGGEEKRDQPGACEQQHDLDRHGKPTCGKESSVEAEDRELYKSYRENVPELQHEQNLFHPKYLQFDSQ